MSGRRAVREDEATGPPVEHVPLGHGPDIWRVRSFDAARQVLRARHLTTQAGFTAERIPRGVFRRHPILISDGEGHDSQRRELARFFAPAVVADRYGERIDELARDTVGRAAAAGRCRLDEVALHFSVAVTSEVVGLTESTVAGMSRRLEGFFTQPPVDLSAPGWGRTRRQWLQAAINGLVPIARFHLADVRPAIRARRRRHRDDVLSHLIAAGHSTSDILVECVTYGTAGMVTTREFISMACWHLLTDRELAAEYLAAEQPRRVEILEEIIRLEPVVGHLFRRAQDDIEITAPGGTVTVPAGDLIDICVRATNTDEQAVGPDPESLCPVRSTADSVPAVGMSFSDGAHKCPGQTLALYETDALLHRLLDRSPTVVAEPTIGWDSVIEGYRLRGLELAFPQGPAREGRRS
ncbi:cytochrome P450 [Brevibacterium renqingii]|uniref:cytochrome P450 n=1 Tax=Brevibacterium renqingii TaxID=2776916 RepID=UPI001ADEF07B|nr:cytochrome P450 [Brevibacterium renqingii]